MTKETELAQWPFQGSSLNFTFVQDSSGWWDTKAQMTAERSEDGINWELAEINMQVIDKDHAKSLLTCWEVFNKIQADCGGNIFEHKDAIVTTMTTDEILALEE